jgi:hypothetical protein
MERIRSSFENLAASPALTDRAVVDPAPVYEFNQYQGCELVRRTRHSAGPGQKNVMVQTPCGTWQVDRSAGVVPYAPAGMAGQRLRLKFTLVEGACADASVGVAFRLFDWSDAVHAFMPGALYQGNRFRSYSCGWYGCYEPEDARPDAEQIVAEIPRLSRPHGGPSRVQLLSRDLTTTAVGFWHPVKKQAVVLLTGQGIAKGDTLFEIEENPEHNDAWLRFTLPGVREKTIYNLEGAQASPDRGVTFAVGETVNLDLVIYQFSCEDLRSFHQFFFAVRKVDMPDRPELPGVTLSRALGLQHKVMAEDRWSEQHRLFWDEPAAPWYFQTGWTGGMIKDYPICATGNLTDFAHVEASLRTYNAGWSPSGLMYGRFDPSGAWTSDNAVPGFAPLESRPYMHDWTLARRHGDVLIYLLKTARLIRGRQPDYQPPPGFYQNIRRSADVLCRTFEKHGQLGQYLDQNTGDICVGGSTAAANVPSGLLMAWKEFGDEKFLKTAEALAAQLYDRYAVHGNMNGTPADVLQSPDCEGPTLLLDSMCDLYDSTGESRWLHMAEHCAWLLATWVSSYDYDFSRHFPDCEFQRLNLKTVGAICASSQNRIGTPGLCVSSGLSLLRLYRATGEVRYLELLRDIAFCLMRAMARPERPSFGEDGSLIPDGWIAERFSSTDVHMPGTFWKASTPWCQTAMLLTCLEIPSLYVVTDRAFVHAFDTVRVDAVRAVSDGLELTLTNPTDFPACYKIMRETSAELATPLPEFHFTKFEAFDFRPHETRAFTLPPL